MEIFEQFKFGASKLSSHQLHYSLHTMIKIVQKQ